MDTTTTSDVGPALAIVTKALREDPELYFSWQANIAVQMMDEFKRRFPGWVQIAHDQLYEATNEAAKKFLNVLTYVPNDDDD